MNSLENIYINTKVNNERPGSAFKLPSTKFDTNPLTSRTKSRIKMNKQYYAQGSTKPLHRCYSIQSPDSEIDCIIANLNLGDINDHNV